jgi:hypothetical protein
MWQAQGTSCFGSWLNTQQNLRQYNDVAQDNPQVEQASLADSGPIHGEKSGLEHGNKRGTARAGRTLVVRAGAVPCQAHQDGSVRA